jgi:AcrR family transcriptional regulator
LKSLSDKQKKQIVETAFKLFKENGFYATGVDLIIKTANVSKRTLYKYFSTKNELIVAVLEHYHETYKEHLHALLDDEEMDSRDKISAIFEDAKRWFGNISFHGCLAVNAMGEFSGKDQAIENSCICFKRWEIDLLLTLAKDIDEKNPDQLAHKLFVLLEGMSAIAQVSKGDYPVSMVEMANEIIDMHLARS